jgi:hypothetical protein
MTAGLMESIEWFFTLVSCSLALQERVTDEQHDKNNDGYLTKDEVIQLSESLLVCPAPDIADNSSFSETSQEIPTLRQSPVSS